MRLIRLIGTLLVTSVALVGCGTSTPVSPSSAKTPDSAPQASSGAGQQVDVGVLLKRLNENPELLDSLSPAQLDTIKPALEPVTVQVQEETSEAPVQAVGVQALTATYCWSTTKSDVLVNVLGMKMFGIFEKVNWCASGGKITSKSYSNWGEVYMITWQYRGASVTQTGGVGATSYTAKSQGTFQSCLGSAGCVSSRYPWVAITANANGSSYYSIGG